MNNSIIVQEVIHSMKLKKWHKGWMTIKVDLGKAYDRISVAIYHRHSFHGQFPNILIAWIMSCISIASMSILWNGGISDEFHLTRVIRQSDSLYLYIFVLCIEQLVHSIQNFVSYNNWGSIQLGKGGPKLSNLFFMYDLLLFVEAVLYEVQVIKNIFRDFGRSLSKKLINRKLKSIFLKVFLITC